MTSARRVTIRDGSIRLGQLLQLAGLVDSGSEAKALLGSEEVLVNGTPERRRGRQLIAGDVVELAGERLEVAGPPSPADQPER